MRNFYITLSAYIFFLLIIFFAVPRNTNPQVGADAVWNPPANFFVQVSKDCPLRLKHSELATCVTGIMEQNGANAHAIAFTKSIGGYGYLSDFRNTGVVDIAHATVMAADHSDAFYLVNGNPSPINVDSPALLHDVKLDNNSHYQQLIKQYPNVFLLPGNHLWPDVRILNDGGPQFIFAYQLKDGCAACATVGTAEIGFNFTKIGRFLGPVLIDVYPKIVQ